MGVQANRLARTRPGRLPFDLLREFVYERVLARVFADGDPSWVVKGGTALLMRVDGARHSKDIDLLYRLQDLDAAQRDLTRALGRDLEDHLRFVVRGTRSLGADQQPGVDGRQVDLEVYVGVKKVLAFHIDLVVGSLMTAEPEPGTGSSLITIAGVEPPRLRLYPIVDHLADKVCATEAVYPGGHQSSRVRDLVDIVLIATSHELDGRAARTALEGERAHRSLPTRTTFDPPESWQQKEYHKAATPMCPPDLGAATDLARSLVEPVMLASADGLVWSPTARAWAAAKA
jgi:hypothetical protein